jgi:hypothetical protein
LVGLDNSKRDMGIYIIEPIHVGRMHKKSFEVAEGVEK